MSKLYGYNDSLWKEIHKFTYTGAPEKFTLSPGTYLFQCYGAHGGRNLTASEYYDYTTYQYGGGSMGILTLHEETDFYAVVGGNGTEGTPGNAGVGGYNGGGWGGFGYSSYYNAGHGGGGATDIRLNIPSDFELPEGFTINPVPGWFKECEYVTNESISNTGYFNTNYIPKENTTVEIKIASDNPATDAFAFGCRNSNGSREFCLVLNEGPYSSPAPTLDAYCHGQYMSYAWSQGTSANPTTIFDPGPLSTPRVYKLSKDGVWVDGVLKQTIPAQTYTASSRTLYLMGCNNGGSFAKAFKGKLYYVKIWEGDTLVAHYVPGLNTPANQLALYDMVSGTLLTPSNSDRFTLGPEVIDPRVTASLLTRIMVAGGGGGGTLMNYSAGTTALNASSMCAVGGGLVGGPVQTNTSSASNNKYASQNDGYSFGTGQSAPMSTYSSGVNRPLGHSGGGGGWYGGYACTDTSSNYTSANGGGGSGYVLTATSYKPVGYEVPEKYYMRSWYMKAGLADDPCVIISELCGDVVAGDVITFGPVGKGCRVSLPPGTYNFRCWGADGGFSYGRKSASAQSGGYSEGTYRTPISVNAYVHVGGSGVNDYHISQEFVRQLCPDLGYNGGGAPSGYTNNDVGHAGGGATDIRINFDSPYARVIVAGGSGGSSWDNYSGGVGGGTTGGSPWGAYGSVPGPGTQTESPQSMEYPTINGGFGYGGNAGAYSSSSSGGAGGGGWYGGSGSMATNNSSNICGGTGGSGFVLTPISIDDVPPDYLLDESHCLADAVTTAGGNNMHPGLAKAEIEVVQSFQQKVLCRDAEGIKYYSDASEAWVLVPDQVLNIAVFTAFGTGTFTSDEGLLDEYEILIWDPTDAVTDIDINVIPLPQTVQQVTRSTLPIKKTFFDLDYDPTKFNVQMSVRRHQAGLDTEIITDVTIDKLANTDNDAKVYYATYLTK